METGTSLMDNRLQFSGSGNIYERCVAQRVDLRCRNNGDTSGIYRCDIETNAVHSDDSSDTTTRETVYAGLYASGGVCVCVCVCVCVFCIQIVHSVSP